MSLCTLFHSLHLRSGYLCVQAFYPPPPPLPPPCSHKVRFDRRIDTRIDGRQIKPLWRPGCNFSAELISFEMIHVHPVEHATAVRVFYLDSVRERHYSSPGENVPSFIPPIKSRVMKLLWVLSLQHCFIKDDTIIFYQLTKKCWHVLVQ